MGKTLLVIILFQLFYIKNYSQDYKVYGKITTTKLEPIAFATISIKDNVLATTSKEDGSYQILLDNGKYECIVSMIGYKTQQFTIAINKKDVIQNIILEIEKVNTKDIVTVTGIKKDKSEEYIKNVIQHKEDILHAIQNYSANIYIKATEENITIKKSKRILSPAIDKNGEVIKVDTSNDDVKNMSMAEIQMQLDFQYPNRIKETRNGVKKRGNPESLFYLSTTEGNFSLYNNLLNVKAVSVTPFLSPISYSGLVAYKYKMIRVRKQNGHNVYTISFKPTKLGNALLTGEVEVMDSSWVILNSKFSLPKFHLVEYDKFDIEQEYSFINDSAWLLSKQKFIYFAKEGKSTMNGVTSVNYNSYELNKVFPKKHFGLELSSTAQEAYDKDSSFWQTVRTEPLTEKEVRFIHYKDSIYQATNTKQYLDSIDAKTNKITLKKVLFDGITFYNRSKERNIYIGSLANLYEPLQPGGVRLGYVFSVNKIYKNKKDISVFTNFNYGLRNKDLNGNVRLSRMYNPFNRGYYYTDIGRSFDQLFEGDIAINSFQKRNLYRKYHITIGHGIELANGLFLNNELEIAYRQSLVGMKFADYSKYIKDSVALKNYQDNLLKFNVPIDFKAHGALYNNITLSYTPFQKYIREPLEKVILGSNWPTFNVKWRKGIPNILGSKVDYDYMEFRISQRLQLGTVGISEYSFVTGNFLNKNRVEQADKKFMRGNDPYLFFSPKYNFQNLDSTFEVTKNFYEFHYVHEFNGAILNKIPIIKKLGLREVAGGGFLYAAERNLKYIEGFFGLESMPFRILTERFKVGLFVVGSLSNQSKDPVQLKLSIRNWDKVKNRWQ
jgi:Family of unknown function (DUF5686)/CarboxypepD_reg-like domain